MSNEDDSTNDSSDNEAVLEKASNLFCHFFINDVSLWMSGLSDEAELCMYRIIFRYRRNEKPLVDDDHSFQKLTGISVRDWKSIRTEIEHNFEIKDGFWHLPAIDKEIARTRKNMLSIQESAKNARQAKANKRATKNNVTDIGKTPGPKSKNKGAKS